MNREFVQAALRGLIGMLDYDLMKSIDDPEEDDGTTWEDVTSMFFGHLFAAEEQGS
jgi:hypothetical protein